MKSAHQNIEFPQEQLLDWYGSVKRDLPWRETKDPYSVWLSEIILQQTRVDQGLPYYNRFIQRFPTVEDLSAAEQNEVLKLWEGLGYYSRARNLQAAAKMVDSEFGGIFPRTYSGLLSLKGIGPYTAAAIASICFNVPVAAVDGNVYRVMSRYFDIRESIDETKTKKLITELANSVVNAENPGDHNQAVMELGATVCTPKSPNCSQCPLQEDCGANASGFQGKLPVRSKKIRIRDRYFYYLIPLKNGFTTIEKRGKGDIWEGLYEFPLKESKIRLSEQEILQFWNVETRQTVLSVSEEFKHILSHQRIMARFILLESNPPKNINFNKVKVEKLSSFAFPRLINRYLEQQNFVIDK